MPKFEHCLLNARTKTTVVDSLQLADRFWSRFCGLQMRAPLRQNQGILLVPCSSIHTHWMRFSIAAIMLDKFGCVLAVHPEIAPWRMRSAPRGTHAVLETATDSVASQLQIGDCLQIATNDPAKTAVSIFDVKVAE